MKINIGSRKQKLILSKIQKKTHLIFYLKLLEFRNFKIVDDMLNLSE